MSTLSQPAAGALARFIASPTDEGSVAAPADLFGFGGLHGGLLCALLTNAAADERPDGTSLRSVTAHFGRAVRDSFTVSTEIRSTGRRVGIVTAEARSGDGVAHASVTATFGAGLSDGPSVDGPLLPDGTGRPTEWDRFEMPVEFVPYSQYMEIRAVGANRPYAGGDDPELTAWVRTTTDDVPPGPLQLVHLLDALAPSYAAVLTALRPIPTVEYAVYPTRATATSPWVLLHAVTKTSHEGWIDEVIDAWDVDGSLLASARQLRVLR